MHLVIQPFDRRQVVAVSRLNADRSRPCSGRSRSSATGVDRGGQHAGGAVGAVAGRRLQLPPLSRQVVHAGQHGRRAGHASRDRSRQQIFAAFRQILPPRNAAAQPPRLVVLGSMDQYQTLLVKLGLTMSFQNPTCFLEDRNVVAIGSDLAHLAAVTRTIAAENAGSARSRRPGATTSGTSPGSGRQPASERCVQRRDRQGGKAGAESLRNKSP